jgi:hypothetical protein
MQAQFRHATVATLCKHMLRHINQARKEFVATQLCKPDNDIYRLLDELERSALTSLNMRTKGERLQQSFIGSS